MKPTLKNKILIIGADHHNTLAVIRCLGRQKCNIAVIVHGGFSSVDDVRLSYSKYAKGKVFIVEEQEEALLDFLKSRISEEKQILFPCTDFAQYVIDTNRLSLEPNYIMPGFEEPGKCAYLMDKWNQYEFAFINNIPMAKTWRISIDKCENYLIPEDITFPCIIKPVISAFGKKSDISICDNRGLLIQKISELAQVGYRTLLVQTFLKKQYEVCAYGALVKASGFSVGAIVKKEREFPPRGGGSLTYARFINNAEIVELAKNILELMLRDGYHGQYDIEFFVCDDGIYLNEINFRHSGNGYALVQNGVLAPYIWCLDASGNPIPTNFKKSVKTGKTHMDEIPDMIHRKEYGLSFFKWFFLFVFTSARSKFDLRDLLGTKAYYNPIIKHGISKFFCRKSRKGK